MRLFRRAPEAPTVSSISARELKAEMDAGRDLAVVDVRQPTGDDVYPGTIPGSIRIRPSELPERYQELPRDRALVLFCT